MNFNRSFDKLRSWHLVFFLLMPCQTVVFAQETAAPDTSRQNAIRLFTDCQVCDMNYIREEMPYVNYVRDVREAQVYLLVTRQSTGSGGEYYTLFYRGLGQFDGMRDTLTYQASPDDTSDKIRQGLTNTIGLGLVRYVMKTPSGNNLSLSYSNAATQRPVQVVDRWNYWVFELQTQPRFSLEKSVESYSLSNYVSADRVTPDWKIQFGFNHSYSKNVYIRERKNSETGEMEEIRTEAVRSSWSASNLTVRSISDHWSAGARAGASSSTFSNIKFKAYLSAALEYNLFPYSQSTRRQLRTQYSIGYTFNQYIDTTIYDKMYDRLFGHSVNMAYRVQDKWGSANFSLGYSAYLHDLTKNRIEINGNVRLRIFKGLSLSVNGGAAFIHNQIELVKGNVTEEDLYLRLRALQTGYSYEGSLGLTYTFGSIYNNVVNPRFGN